MLNTIHREDHRCAELLSIEVYQDIPAVVVRGQTNMLATSDMTAAILDALDKRFPVHDLSPSLEIAHP